MEKDSKEAVEAQRKELLKDFTRECNEFAARLQKLCGRKPEIEIQEWTSDDLPDFYYLHADFKITDILSLLSLTWDHRRAVLDRNVITLTKDFQGKGLGTLINGETEQLAKRLKAKVFLISAIVEPRWKESLLKQGFTQDPKDESTVFKKLQ